MSSHEWGGDFELFTITEDVITVIAPFLSLDDRLKFIRISKTWLRAIRSLQRMWCDDVFIGILRGDRTIGLEGGEKEYWEAYPNNSNEDSVDWMKVVQLQFLKLPKKMQVKKHQVTKILGESHYGNVDLVELTCHLKRQI